MSELAVNAAKHGNRGKGSIGIRVRLRKSRRRLCLTFGDRGPGFGEALLRGDASSFNTGMEMIEGIVTGTMDGTIERFNDNGAMVRITFALPLSQSTEERRGT